eukprot:1140070-Pelagomonas_calceolata.AAC.2
MHRIWVWGWRASPSSASAGVVDLGRRVETTRRLHKGRSQTARIEKYPAIIPDANSEPHKAKIRLRATKVFLCAIQWVVSHPPACTFPVFYVHLPPGAPLPRLLILSTCSAGPHADSIFIQGFELSVRAAARAEKSCQELALMDKYSVSSTCFFQGYSDSTPSMPTWLFANPPYLPSPDADILMLLLEVKHWSRPCIKEKVVVE